MERFGHIIGFFDSVLNSRRKRHLAGGLLLSTSLLFGSLALTIMTIKDEEVEY